MLELTKQQRNVILQIIQQNGLDPARFSWKQRPSEWNTKIVPPNSTYFMESEIPDGAESLNITVDDKQYYFTFEDGLQQRYGAAMKPRLDGLFNVAADSWNSLLSYFAQWLSIIRSEIEEPDLWKNPPSNPTFRVPESYKDESGFTEVERRQIKLALRDMQGRIKENVAMTQPEVLKLEQTFIYLEGKLETSSKIDWKNMFVGTIVALMAEPWLAPYASALRDFVLEKIAPVFPHFLIGS